MTNEEIKTLAGRLYNVTTDIDPFNFDDVTPESIQEMLTEDPHAIINWLLEYIEN